MIVIENKMMAACIDLILDFIYNDVIWLYLQILVYADIPDLFYE